jgi:tetratricopeptide (TPR) repeat protein
MKAASLLNSRKSTAFFCWKIICLVVIAFYPEQGATQNRKIDSLRTLALSKTGSEHSYILPDIALEYILLGDYKHAIQYADEALQIAHNNGDSLLLVRSAKVKASALRRSGETDSAKFLFNQILPISKRNSYDFETEIILNSLANIYTTEAHYDTALSHLFESLNLRYKHGNKADIGIVLNNIGMIYYKLADYNKALSFYLRSLQLKNEINDEYDLDVLLINISLCYIYINNFSKARSYIERGVTQCGKLCSDHILVSSFYSLGLLSFKQKNFVEAENNLLESYALSKKSRNTRYQLDNIIILSEIYLQNNQLSFAEKYLQEALLVIAKDEHFNLELIGIYSQFFTLYSRLKNFEKVAYYQDKYIALKDSIFTNKLTNNLMRLEAEHLEKENQIKIGFQNRMLLLNKEVIFRQRMINVFIGVVTLLVMILAIVLAKSNQQKRKANEILDQKVKKRTQDLELSRNTLQRALGTQDARMHKLSTDIKNSIVTIKALCSLGLKDIDNPKDIDNHNVRVYLTKVDSVSDHIFEGLNRTFYSNGLDTIHNSLSIPDV